MTAARGAMVYRATIERRGRVPDGGGGFTDEWSVIGEAVPCWAWVKSSLVAQEGGKPAIVDTRHVTVPTGTIIQVGDRVTVRNRTQDRTIFPAMIIDSVGERPDHLHCQARRIS